MDSTIWMKKITGVTFVALSLCLMISCATQKKYSQQWYFDSLEGWDFDHQDDNPLNQLEVENGILKIFTRAHSRDRKKIRTAEKKYTSGRYTWKTYIPVMGTRDQASVGSWIYADDRHELDFEVGHGKEAERKKVNAASDEMLVYMTSQAFPFSSRVVAVKPGWHIFEIDLTLRDDRYFVTWWIDEVKHHELQLEYGAEISFYIYCSVENLKFIGDHIPKQQNYGLFEYVNYQYHR